MKSTNKMKDSYISVMFEDENELLDSIAAVQKDGIKIYDVYTPFHVHGLGEALKIKPTRIPIVAFISGAIGTISALLFQSWISVLDWPINIGGKPFFALPSFIPVTFEITVLFSAFGMIGAFFYKSKLFPGNKPKIHNDQITNDCFLMLLEFNKTEMTEDKKIALEKLLYKHGAFDIEFVENLKDKE